MSTPEEQTVEPRVEDPVRGEAEADVGEILRVGTDAEEARPDTGTDAEADVDWARPNASAEAVGAEGAWIHARGLSFGYPGHAVLTDFDLDAGPGDRLAVVGENGVGKSTLLSLLAGRLLPQAGVVRARGTVALVDQVFTPGGATVGEWSTGVLAGPTALLAELEDAAREVGRDAVASRRYAQLLARAERSAAWDAPRRLAEAVDRLGAPTESDRPLAELSVGQRHRLRLAGVLAVEPDVLLLDEPTNHLDAEAADYLAGRLAARRGPAVFVSHDRAFVDAVAGAIVDMDPAVDGRPVRYRAATWEDYRRERRAALDRWERAWALQVRRLDRLRQVRDAAYENLSDEWRPPKGSQKHRRATRARTHVKAADRGIERLQAQGLEIPPPPARLTFPVLPSTPAQAQEGEALVRLRGAGVPGRLAPVDLSLLPGGRLLVVGPNGSGKSTLLALLAGRLEAGAGQRWAIPGLRLGVLAQDLAPLPEMSEGQDPTGFGACERLVVAMVRAGEVDPAHVVPVLSTGLVTMADMERPVAELSVGRRRRLDLACTLVAAPHALIWDEPTNHLSPGLVDDLTESLAATPAAVVLATHDRRMRADLADWPVLDLGPR